MKGINASLEHVTGLAWGLHGPFRDYIARMSDGRMQTDHGAEVLASGETLFPIDAADSSEDELRCRGLLQFIGHGGMLAVSVQDPWLQHHDGSTVMTIVDPFEPDTRMPLVRVEFTPEGIGTTRLTEEGTDLFMANYPTDTFFDPVRIVRAAKDDHHDYPA